MISGLVLPTFRIKGVNLASSESYCVSTETNVAGCMNTVCIIVGGQVVVVEQPR